LFAVTKVPATVHVTVDTAESKVSESSPQPATSKDVYSTLNLDVTVDSIKLALFTGDSDLVSVTFSLYLVIAWPRVGPGRCIIGPILFLAGWYKVRK